MKRPSIQPWPVKDCGDQWNTNLAYQSGLLLALARRAGRILSREALLDLVKSEALEAFDRALDMHMSRGHRGQSEEAAARDYRARCRLRFCQEAGLTLWFQPALIASLFLFVIATAALWHFIGDSAEHASVALGRLVQNEHTASRRGFGRGTADRALPVGGGTQLARRRRVMDSAVRTLTPRPITASMHMISKSL